MARALVEQPEWVLLLRDFATSSQIDAYLAIELLAGDQAGPAGLEILRELYRSDAVVDGRARQALAHQARVRGW